MAKACFSLSKAIDQVVRQSVRRGEVDFSFLWWCDGIAEKGEKFWGVMANLRERRELFNIFKNARTGCLYSMDLGICSFWRVGIFDRVFFAERTSAFPMSSDR